MCGRGSTTGNPIHSRDVAQCRGRSRTSVELSMSDRDQFYPLDRRVWLLAIGRRLRVEYDAIASASRSARQTIGKHHAMDRRDRTLLYDSGEKGLVPGVELGRYSRRRDIDETVRSLLVEPDHPVPQRLTIHATDRGRLFPRGAVEHGRNR